MAKMFMSKFPDAVRGPSYLRQNWRPAIFAAAGKSRDGSHFLSLFKQCLRDSVAFRVKLLPRYTPFHAKTILNSIKINCYAHGYKRRLKD
jgi:hypothetical protein